LELIAAAEGGDLSSLRKALAQGARIDARDARGRTALLAAMQSNRGEAVKALLEAVVLSDGGPPHQRIVQMLVEYKADVNLADRNGVTRWAMRGPADSGKSNVFWHEPERARLMRPGHGGRFKVFTRTPVSFGMSPRAFQIKPTRT
jgi:hypothetical protein